MRTKGEAGTGDVIEAVRHMRRILAEIKTLSTMTQAQLKKYAQEERVDLKLVEKIKREQKLPVVNFAAGGIATPADAALLMQLGAEGVFVGSGIFKSKNPAQRARAIVLATAYYMDSKKIMEASEGLGEGMFGIQAAQVETRLQERGKHL
jgi:pyridoxal 5'-phosphate synthase pdxS subunit